MRKVLIIAFALLCFASGKLSAQPASDTSEILKKVIDLPQLQEYYPLDQNNSPKQLIVLQHGVSFHGVSVSHNSQPLAFRSKAEVASEPAYFLFWTFSINGASAEIVFSYNYNLNTPSRSAKKVTLSLTKSGNTWTITNTNIETVQL